MLKALAALGNVGVTKQLARYGNLPPDLLVDLLKTKWQQRQALARSRRVMDAAIAVLCEDSDERVHHYARKEWKRRHREERPGAERLAQARAEIAALGGGQVKHTDDDLLALYTQDPERWPELIQNPGAGLKLLRAGFKDGRDPRPSPFYRRRYARDVDFVASLLPSGAKLHAQAAGSSDLLFLIACLIRYETSKTLDERLADALAQNPILQKIGVRELTMAGAVRIWNWDHVETSPYYPRRTAALDARMKEERA